MARRTTERHDFQCETPAPGASRDRFPPRQLLLKRSPWAPALRHAVGAGASHRKGGSAAGKGRDMPRRCRCPLAGLLVLLGAGAVAHAGRRVCSVAAAPGPAAVPVSHVQPVYQPYLTTCAGQRLCSTYRTLYKVSYRLEPRQAARPAASCCPGWSRASGPALGCNRAVCWAPCRNGGSCVFPNRCSCPPGWTGPACETDVDECARRSHGCGQLCANVPGSYRCSCRAGFRLATDGRACEPEPDPRPAGPQGPSSEMKEEMRDLKARVEVLEQKLQSVLAPFHDLMPSAPDDVGTDPVSRLSHSLRQLDRIDSLSEQISFLEERLETCSCRNEL
ncbi:epidermal growth factor-like protein 7 [Eudromia elegans]